MLVCLQMLSLFFFPHGSSWNKDIFAAVAYTWNNCSFPCFRAPPAPMSRQMSREWWIWGLKALSLQQCQGTNQQEAECNSAALNNHFGKVEQAVDLKVELNRRRSSNRRKPWRSLQNSAGQFQVQLVIRNTCSIACLSRKKMPLFDEVPFRLCDCSFLIAHSDGRGWLPLKQDNSIFKEVAEYYL